MRASLKLKACAYSRSTAEEMQKNKGRDDKISSMRLFDNKLFLLGTNFDRDIYLKTWDVDNLKVGNPVLDIKSISEIVKLPNGAYILSVDDYNRLNNQTRKTILELKDGSYTNIAVETQVLQMVIKGSSLMIYGKDIDLNKTKIFSYTGSSFNSIGNAFAMNKWYNYKNGLTFISGKADAETKESVFLLSQNLTKIMPEFSLEKMVQLNQNIYGLVGKFTATNVDPDFKSKKVMVIFDAATLKYTVVKAAPSFELTASEYKN
jgi:hypothetical protein